MTRLILKRYAWAEHERFELGSNPITPQIFVAAPTSGSHTTLARRIYCNPADVVREHNDAVALLELEISDLRRALADMAWLNAGYERAS